MEHKTIHHDNGIIEYFETDYFHSRLVNHYTMLNGFHHGQYRRYYKNDYLLFHDYSVHGEREGEFIRYVYY